MVEVALIRHHLLALWFYSFFRVHNQDHLFCMVILLFARGQDFRHPLDNLYVSLIVLQSINEKSEEHITCLCLRLLHHFQFTPHLRSKG